jgi:hypothetical protein
LKCNQAFEEIEVALRASDGDEAVEYGNLEVLPKVLPSECGFF